MAGVVFGSAEGAPPRRRCDTADATMVGGGSQGRGKATSLSEGGETAVTEKSRIERRLKELQRERTKLLLERRKGAE